MPVLATTPAPLIDLARDGAELRALGAVVLPDPFEVNDLLAAARAAVARARNARQRSAAALARLSSGWAKPPPV